MAVQNGQQYPSMSHPERVSLESLREWLATRAEGDEWDFKETLGDLTTAYARVNLAKDALAFCSSPDGGTLIVGVADDFNRVGLEPSEQIDTTKIRNAIAKYIDGDFNVLAASYELVDPDDSKQKRYGIIYFRRLSSQPVLAAQQGDHSKGR